MKYLRSVWLLCMMGLAVTVAEEPWLKPPDGFVWPDSAAVELESDTQLLLSDLPVKVRSYLIDQYAPQSPPPKIYVRRVDLNSDGVLEWFVDRPELGGTGGGAYNIIDVSGSKARNIGDLLGGFHLCAAAPKERWLRIECSGRAGGGHFIRDLLQYKDGEYQTVRSEDHDMINNKVTLQK